MDRLLEAFLYGFFHYLLPLAVVGLGLWTVNKVFRKPMHDYVWRPYLIWSIKRDVRLFRIGRAPTCSPRTIKEGLKLHDLTPKDVGLTIEEARHYLGWEE